MPLGLSYRRQGPRWFILLFLHVFLWGAVYAALPPFRQGFSYVTYSAGSFSQPSSTKSLSLMASPSVGIRAVEIMATYFVANSANATAIHPTASSPTDADVAAAIRDALAAGLTPVLKPHIDCLDGVWRANIGTKFTTEAQWTAWFSNYTAFITHCAFSIKPPPARQAQNNLPPFNPQQLRALRWSTAPPLASTWGRSWTAHTTARRTGGA